MARRAVNGLLPQYSKNAGGTAAADYWLKLYAVNTTTEKTIFTLQSGGSSLSKCMLNSRGETINNQSDDDSTFIPYVDGNYDAYLFSSEADADANNTIAAVFLGQNILEEYQLTSLAIQQFATVADLVAGIGIDGNAINFSSLTNAGLIEPDVSTVVHNTTSNNGGALYTIVNVNPGNLATLVSGILRGANIDLGGGYYAKIKYSSRMSIFSFGVVNDLGDQSTAMNAAFDYMAANNGGTLTGSGDVYFGAGTLCNIKPRVKLLGSNLRLIQGDQGAAASAFVYLKDYAEIENVKLSLSDTLYQRATVDKDAYNKVGITTQGAALGVGMRVKNVGFEKVMFSCVLVFNGAHDVIIEDCYTFGQQIGKYADFDATTHIISNWNALVTDADHAAKLAAGTRAYCLTNFHNSQTGTYDVTIRNNHVENINDTFAAPNGGAQRHKIYANSHRKTLEGYYGGYGIDFNGCSGCSAWGNTISGSSIGVYFHDTAFGNSEWGNHLYAALGVASDNAGANKSSGSFIYPTRFGSGGLGIGPLAGIVSGGSSAKLKASDHHVIATSAGTLQSKAITNCYSYTAGPFVNVVGIECAGHGLVSRQIVAISGVGGATSANDAWQVKWIDANNIALLNSTFAGPYTTGGTLQYSSNGHGFATYGPSSSVIRTSDINISDFAVAACLNSTGQIRDADVEINNTANNLIGTGKFYRSSLANSSGISSSGTRSLNLGGTVTILAGTTTTAVTFANAEIDSNYKIVLSNNNQSLGLYWTSKTTAGFTLNHTSPGFDRAADWLIFR